MTGPLIPPGAGAGRTEDVARREESAVKPGEEVPEEDPAAEGSAKDPDDAQRAP